MKKNRHHGIGKYVHWKRGQHYNLPHAEKLYEQKPPSVLEVENVNVLCDFTIQANGPDFIISLRVNFSLKHQLSQESEWQQVTSGLKDTSQYSILS